MAGEDPNKRTGDRPDHPLDHGMKDWTGGGTRTIAIDAPMKACCSRSAGRGLAFQERGEDDRNRDLVGGTLPVGHHRPAGISSIYRDPC
ncbi:hypothetical protein [Methanosphaerula subterraneus]|uniref:hypothetical protein n=1 Tax=Methanosphaerula subterraneus TaxID=3350244 RepID=UPI003F866AC9